MRSHGRRGGLEDRRRAVGCLFGGAMVAAPFLALAYGVTPALAVMAAGLGATAYLALDARGRAEPVLRRRLLIAAIVNGVLAAVCLAAVLARIA